VDTQTWIKDLFEAVDSLDANKFVGFLTDDAVFRFANAAPVEGKEVIRGALNGFFSSINGMKHEILECWQQDSTVICRGEVTYTKKDASEFTIPFANFLKTKGELVKDYLVYMDASQLYVDS
jgi:ketosteroid isomerase-like protein